VYTFGVWCGQRERGAVMQPPQLCTVHPCHCAVFRYHGPRFLPWNLVQHCTYADDPAHGHIHNPGVYFGMSRLYSTCIPPASHRILVIPLYPCYVYLHLAVLQQIHCIPLYLTDHCIQLYPYVSSCIPLYLIVYPTASKTGY